MGGALVTGADPAHLFACQVVRAEYERALSQDPDSDPVLIDTTDSQYRDRLVHLYTAALVEWQLPLEVCRQPAVVLFKYLLLGVGERADYHQAVMGAAEGRERQKGGGGGGGKGGGKGGKKEDYSASFGGTEADSRNEREAAAILRGGEEAAEEEPPLLLPPLLTPPWVPWELQCLRTGGGWGRVMGGSGCYLYLHALTKELLSVRPADFVEHTEEGGVGVGDGGGVGGELDPSNGLTCVCMADLLAGVGEVTAGGKTALLVDASQEQGVRAFYSYKGVLEDVSCLTIPFGKSGIKQEQVMERCRAKLVSALKTGSTFALYLGAVGIEHADIKGKLCRKDVFPREAFQAGGQKLLQPDYAPRYKCLFRESELEAGQAIAREGFSVVVITSLNPVIITSQLEECIPLGHMVPLYVT